MAKTGFPYYQSETDRFQDIKIKRLKKEFSASGYAVYSYILNEIYRVQGCFLEWDESTAFDVSEYWNLKETTVKEIVNYCCAVGLFDKELLTNESVLSSRSIQTRYIKMCTLTKRRPNIPEKYMLLSGKDTENSEFSSKTPEEFTHSKEEYKRVKENKEYPPLTPPLAVGKEGDYLSSSLSQKDGIPRNLKGLVSELERINIRGKEHDLILELSNYGEIGHPVWKIIPQVSASINKPAAAKDKIRMPGRFIISKLKENKQ